MPETLIPFFDEGGDLITWARTPTMSAWFRYLALINQRYVKCFDIVVTLANVIYKKMICQFWKQIISAMSWVPISILNSDKFKIQPNLQVFGHT